MEDMTFIRMKFHLHCGFARSSWIEMGELTSSVSAVYSYVSSANMAVRLSMSPGISLTNIVKSFGPRIDPRGTPLVYHSQTL